MKNNRVTIVLLGVAVVAIWGTIVFKLFRKDPAPDSNYPTGFYEDKADSAVADKYTLLLNYPDPFFPSKKRTKTVVQKKKVTKNQKKVQRWPSIKYNGCISNDSISKGFFICNGNSIILTSGDSINNNMLLKKIHKDSALISFGHEQKWIYK